MSARTKAQGVLIAAVCLGSVLANTRMDAPPRYDGAGYAVLARSLIEGRGYREIDHPDAPRHAHFPPGYPLALAALWAVTGPSVAWAHALSAVCTVAAALLAWRTFLRGDRPGVALAMALALAVNWRWGRDGGGIQSEPLFHLLGFAAVLSGGVVADRGGPWRGLALGILLGLATLTRHVGVMLALAMIVHLAWAGRRREALVAAIACVFLVAPWIAWLANVGTHTQVALVPVRGLGGVMAGNAAFYARRLSDALIGPVIEVATVFRPKYATAATIVAWVAALPIVAGWGLLLKRPERRVLGLVPLFTMALLLAWPFTEAGRFLVPLVPFVIAGAVEAIAAVGRGRRLAAAGLILAISLPYPIYAIATGRADAARGTHGGFDAACAWLATQDGASGPVLTRHPGEVFWQTGRKALAPPDGATAEDVAGLVERRRVSYLLVDDERFALAPTSPLGRFARAFPERVERVFAGGAVVVYRVL